MTCTKQTRPQVLSRLKTRDPCHTIDIPLFWTAVQMWFSSASQETLRPNDEEAFVFLSRLLIWVRSHSGSFMQLFLQSANSSKLPHQEECDENNVQRRLSAEEEAEELVRNIHYLWWRSLSWRFGFSILSSAIPRACSGPGNVKSVIGHQLNEGFTPLGGHSGAWLLPARRVNGSAIVKKTSLVEGAFYAAVAKMLRRDVPGALHPQLRAALSTSSDRKFWQQENGPETDVQQLRSLHKFLPHVYTLGTELDDNVCYVEMENLTAGHGKLPGQRPHYCAMDLKIGTRLWGLDADDKKKDRMIAKAKSTTAAATGLCVIAYRCTDPLTGEIVRSVTRQDTRDVVTPYAMYQHLATFFAWADSHTLMEFDNQVSDLIKLFRNQSVAHFHSSSLLFIYDSRGKCCGDPPKLRIIDFAHASLYHQEIDQSFLTGLLNLRRFLRLFCHRHTQPND